VGIVGCGNVAFDDHVPAYAALPDLYRIVAVADPSPERRRLVGERAAVGSGSRHADAADLVARADIDVVDVCTPPALHRGIIEAAIAAGHNVVCEKPLATSPADAEAIVDVVAAAGATFGMVHNYLWFPEIVAVRDLMISGAIGEPQVVLLDALGLTDNPGASGFRPRWRHGTWAGGGVLMDLIHLVYLAETLLGSPIERVSATLAAPPGSAVESLALCRFETSDRTALVNAGWGTGPGGLRVSGTDGRIEVRYQDGATGPWMPLELATVALTGQEPRPLDLGTDRRTHRATFADFGQAVLGGRRPAADAAAGARAVMATVGAYASAATGTTVVLPLAPDDPVRRQGVAGLHGLAMPPWSPVRRLGLFGTEA
jgi:predicted dehydrogenase